MCTLTSWEGRNHHVPQPRGTLDKRPEILCRCPPQRKYLLSNYDSKDWLIA